MGLDMHLKKSTYIGAHYPHRKIEGAVKLTENGRPIPIRLNRLMEVTEILGQWRKANAIHGWFVRNCANDVDDCKPVPVTREDLKSLLGIVREARKHPSEFHDELPPTEGFFFGSTDDLEDYHQDLADTEEILTKALQEPEDGLADFYYEASW